MSGSGCVAARMTTEIKYRIVSRLVFCIRVPTSKSITGSKVDDLHSKTGLRPHGQTPRQLVLDQKSSFGVLKQTEKA